MGSARELYQRWLYELWTTADLALAEELVSSDFVGHWPDGEVHGPAGVAEAIARSLALFSDVSTSVEVGPIVEGDLVAARWRFDGRYAGGLPGMDAPAGTPATLRGADVLRVTDGKIAEYWVSSDADRLAAQLAG